MIEPEDLEAIAEAAGAIRTALAATIVEARKASGLEGEILNIATAMAISMLLVSLGKIEPNIPITVRRSLIETERGYGKCLDMTEPLQ
jgi:hypothetical protein